MAKKAPKKAAKKVANATPTRQTIKTQVVAAIDAEAGRNNAPAGQRTRLQAGDEDVKLENDLRIGESRRMALSLDYSDISTSHGGLPVGPTSSSKADTLLKAVDLVFKRAHRVWN